MKNDRNKEGFKVPEGYFENFEQRFSEKLEEPGAFLPGDDGFGIPAGYFETFNSRLSQHLNPGEPRVVRLYDYKKLFAAAASIAALIALVVMLPMKDDPQPSFDSLAGTDIVDYMQFDELDLTDAEIAQLIPVDELELNDMLEDRLEDEQIIEYLDNSVDDYEDLNIDIDE